MADGVDLIVLVLLGVLVGHPAAGNIRGSWAMYDDAFDDWSAYLGWVS